MRTAHYSDRMRPDAIKADRREGGARSKRHQATEEQDINLEHSFSEGGEKNNGLSLHF